MSSSSSFSYSPSVFLCFRGEDTKNRFTSHLYKALKDSGNRTVMDVDLPIGANLSEILYRIERADISVVVYSENFASSTWCLDELVKILECKQKTSQDVFPVFYDVQPSDLRGTQGKTAELLAELETLGSGPAKIAKWRLALKNFADLKGWHFKEWDEAQLVSEIVKQVQSKHKGLEMLQRIGSLTNT